MIKREVRTCKYEEVSVIIKAVTENENLNDYKLLGVDVKKEDSELCNVIMTFDRGATIKQQVVVIKLEGNEEFKDSYVDVNKSIYWQYTVQFLSCVKLLGRKYYILCFERNWR